MKPDPYLSPLKKINSNAEVRFTHTSETMKPPEENIWKKFPDMVIGKDFLEITLKAQATK